MRSNCVIWAVQQKLKHGGKINWHKAKTWRGFHASWTDPNTGITWEYTVRNQRRKPWWYVPLLYNGIIKKRRLR